MERRTLSSLSLVTLLLAGCGGGSSSGHGSEVSSAASIETGEASLSNLFAGGEQVRESSLRSAQKAFDAAFVRTPNDPRAAMGYGVSAAALVAADLIPALGASSRGASPDDSASVATLRRLFLARGVGASLGLRGRTALVSRAQGASLADGEATLRTVVARLTDARIEALEANPLILPLAGDSGLVVKLGTVEGYALRSAVRAALGATDASLAYGSDETDGDVSFASRFETEIAAGAPIPPSAYLPGGNWGTLAADGADRLARARAEGLGTADDGSLALDRLAARSGTGWLTALVPITATQKTDLASGFDLLKRALGDGASLPLADGVSATVTLGAFLENPPRDLRALYPSLRASGGVLRPVEGSLADPTFGGLVPGGVPAVAVYGRTLAFDERTTLREVREWAFLPNALVP